jgi:hypothetical protein
LLTVGPLTVQFPGELPEDAAYRGQSLALHHIPSLRFPYMEILYLFLESFFGRDICCHLACRFVAYLARVLESFRSVNIYVALTDHPS